MKNQTRYQDQWKYSLVIIIMMYVTSKSCPDTEFSVHQCTKINHNHKHLHEEEVLSVCNYLPFILEYGKSEGLVIRHSSKMAVDCYIYADFSGLYGSED